MRIGFRLLVVLLLLVQGWIGFSRGQMVCIALAPCAEHAAAAGCGDHAHGAVPAERHEHDDCACHVHVGEIDEEQAPVPAPVAVAAPAACALGVTPIAMLGDAAPRACATAPPPRPPALLVPLRSTRLVV